MYCRTDVRRRPLSIRASLSLQTPTSLHLPPPPSIYLSPSPYSGTLSVLKNIGVHFPSSCILPLSVAPHPSSCTRPSAIMKSKHSYTQLLLIGDQSDAQACGVGYLGKPRHPFALLLVPIDATLLQAPRRCWCLHPCRVTEGGKTTRPIFSSNEQQLDVLDDARWRWLEHSMDVAVLFVDRDSSASAPEEASGSC